MTVLWFHTFQKKPVCERKRLIREEQERVAKELKERKDSELKRFTDLYKNALQLHHATILRKYIEASNDKSDVSNEWREWVRKKIDWYDPLINGNDEILDESYKEAAYKYFLSYGIVEK